MTSQDLDDLKKQAEFERLLTAANVFRRRGEYSQAGEAIRKALELQPTDLNAREFAADLVFAHGDIEKAVEHYKRILDEDPKRASVEAKYAKAILQVAEGKRQQNLLRDLTDNPKPASAQPRNSVLAVLLSTAPGFGHLYCMQYMKGMVIFGAWILAWLLCLAFIGPPGERLSTGTVFFGCVAGCIHIYALLDASVTAEKLKKAKQGLPSSEPE